MELAVLRQRDEEVREDARQREEGILRYIVGIDQSMSAWSSEPSAAIQPATSAVT